MLSRLLLIALVLIGAAGHTARAQENPADANMLEVTIDGEHYKAGGGEVMKVKISDLSVFLNGRVIGYMDVPHLHAHVDEHGHEGEPHLAFPPLTLSFLLHGGLEVGTYKLAEGVASNVDERTAMVNVDKQWEVKIMENLTSQEGTFTIEAFHKGPNGEIKIFKARFEGTFTTPDHSKSHVISGTIRYITLK